jgi:hypothetical protein
VEGWEMERLCGWNAASLGYALDGRVKKAIGEAVQVEPMKPKLKAPATQGLKVK